ncbi:GNAT family N-acetyltransferase [Bythopirellula goksoeyrii]|uniref:N-acetyltransferase domain-containing protein n=1 Tax=Bythopirellula goksoeyrii TaxID=1400387 RepID=A0A5B9QIL1_9BACT|nr:N-acetyltransferase [Bythopirellula goksoeyrii]QEG34071.1 hypothetical protein Pr1d_13430 [Bythopirellula goksoeyrii]
MIRSEEPEDLQAIHTVHVASFPTNAEAQLVDLLREADRLSVSLVAEADSLVVGHIAFSPVTVESGEVGAGLAPIAVIESYRKQGVAAELVRAGLQACRENGFGWVVVLGEPGYYARCGFQPATEFGLSDEYGGGVAFQVVELVEGSLPVGDGLVKYAPEFASLG